MKESEVVMGIDLCMKKVNMLLNDAQILIENNKDNESAHALALYTFAVEEYGKALLLKDCLNNKQPNGDVIVPMWIFAKKKEQKTRARYSAHEKKFFKAYDILPKECKNLKMGITHENKGKSKRVKTSHGTMIVPKSTPSGFVSYSGPIDFDTRMQCFYVDWDDENKEWKYEMKSSNSDLKAAIVAYRNELSKQKS